MNKYFESIVANAILHCEGRCTDDDIFREGFSKIYPFTTENISGYISNFDLNNKSLLTVGSSGDQVINPTFYNCKDITVIDICPYTKFYFYLKKSALLTLNYNQFLNFFCYNDFPKTFEDNINAFNIKSYKKIYSVLRLLDYESYLFFDELFNLFDSKTIKENLMDFDESRNGVICGYNNYLRNEITYNILKKELHNISFKFIKFYFTRIS